MPQGGLQDTWPPRAILPYPLGTHLSGQGGPGSGRTDTGTLDFEHLVRGCVCFQGLCVRGSPTYFTVPSFRLPFSKTTFLRYFIYYKICQVEVVSSVFTKLCSHHHSLILECLNSPRRNHAHDQLPPVPLSPQPQVTLIYFFLCGFTSCGKFTSMESYHESFHA